MKQNPNPNPRNKKGTKKDWVKSENVKLVGLVKHCGLA